MFMILSSVAAAVLCLGIVAQLIREDIEAQRELRRTRPPYMPRHALPGHDTVRIPIAAVRAALAQQVEVVR